MLVNLRDVLPQARRKGYAVPHFDCVEDIFIRAILDVAEEESCPVILAALGHDLGGRGIEYISGLVRSVAGGYSVPVVLHLDHAEELELIERAIDHGFTSVMYDGSQLPFRENIRNTRKVVRKARLRGVSVEAELGFVGGAELSGESSGESRLTDPAQVVEFVSETGIDALAVSIGTSHGVYESEPELNIPRLQEINRVSKVPLVLHGGSGTPDVQILTAIRNGISKVNIYSDLRAAAMAGLKSSATFQSRTDPLPDEMFSPIRQALHEAIREKIRLTYHYPQLVGKVSQAILRSRGFD